jgi:hypothetical protein
MGVGKRFVQLLRGPGWRRRISDIEMQHFAALVRQDQKDIEDAEVAVGTTKKSTATRSLAWLWRKTGESPDDARRWPFGVERGAGPSASLATVV